MALCNEFGVRVCNDDCAVAMVADSSCCYCAHCGARCDGLFGGCPAVWASGKNGEGIEVEIRVPGPVADARCVTGLDREDALDGTAALSTVGAPASNADAWRLLSDRLADLEALVRRNLEPASTDADEEMAGVASRLDRLEQTIARKLSMLEDATESPPAWLADVVAAIAGPDAAPQLGPPAWARELRQQLVDVRAALSRLVG